MSSKSHREVQLHRLQHGGTQASMSTQPESPAQDVCDLLTCWEFGGKRLRRFLGADGVSECA